MEDCRIAGEPHYSLTRRGVMRGILGACVATAVFRDDTTVMAADKEADAFIGARAFTFQMTIPPGLHRNAPFVFPLPLRATQAQRTTYEIGGAARCQEHDLAGDAFLLDIRPAPGQPVRITTIVRRKGVRVVPRQMTLAEATAEVSSARVGYFKRSWGPFSHTIAPVQAAVSSHTNAASVVKTLEAFSKWVGDAVSARIVNGTWEYWPNLASILQHGNGQCEQQASCLIAACREAGIPARLVYGMGPQPPISGVTRLDGHTWGEVYVPGSGWLPLEQGVTDSLGVYPDRRIDYGYHPLPGYFARTSGVAGGRLPPRGNAETAYPGFQQYLIDGGKADDDKAIVLAHRTFWDCVAATEFPCVAETQPQKVTISELTSDQLKSRLEGTLWHWPGQMQWFRLRAGGSVENRWNKGRGTWRVDPDLSVTLRFDGPGSTYRVHFLSGLIGYTATGTDNKERIEDVRLKDTEPPATSPKV